MNRYRVDTYEPDSLEHRAPVTTELLNPRLDALNQFLIRSVIRAANTKEQVREVALGITYSNALQLLQQAETLSHLDAVRANSPNKTIHVSFYEAKDSTIPPDENISRERLFGQITLSPTSIFSKIPTYTDSMGNIRPRRNVTLERDGESLDSETHPLYWALNGQPDRFWIDDTATANQSTQIVVGLPPGIRNEINRITVIPFPSRACLIESLEYRGPAGYRIAPGFLSSLNPVRAHFAPGTFEDQIRITLRATSVHVGDEYRHLWGLSSINAAIVDYASSGIAYSKVSAIGSDTFSRITSFSADYFVDSSISISQYAAPPVEFALTKTDGTVVYSSTTNRFPLATGDQPVSLTGSPTVLYLKTTLREPSNRITPLVRNVTFTYE